MLPLIDKDLEETIPPLYAQDGNPTKIIYARFYLHNWSWYVMEYSKLQRLCFGIVDGLEIEYGYFTIDELESIGASRDYEFKPIKIKDKNYERVA